MTIYTEKEIEILREGGKRLSSVIHKLMEYAKPGIMSSDLENMTRKLMKEQGCEPAFLGYRPDGAPRSYPSALCLSINDEVVHGIPNENPVELKSGDVVTIDAGLTHDGLITDMAKTIIVGEQGDTVKKNLLKATHESLHAGIQVARAGNHIGDIGSAIESVVKKYGFNIVPELGGHGVGKSVHEEPFVPNYGKVGKGVELKAGMVLALEPIVTVGDGAVFVEKDGYTYKTVDGSDSAHFEHTILITDGDAEVLTQKQ